MAVGVPRGGLAPGVVGAPRRSHGLTRRSYTLLSPLLPVTDDAFRRALALGAPGLGTNERLHAGTCEAHGIEAIVSADAAFDAFAALRRVDPLDAVATAALLTTT
jgi:predicted nucleic acid-binding protein